MDIVRRRVAVNSFMPHSPGVYSVSQKILPWGFLTFPPKRLGIFRQNVTRLLHVPIYARLQISIQSTATVAKLCYLSVTTQFTS